MLRWNFGCHVAGGGRGFPQCRVSVSLHHSQQGGPARWEKSSCCSLLDGTSCCPLALFLVESKAWFSFWASSPSPSPTAAHPH